MMWNYSMTHSLGCNFQHCILCHEWAMVIYFEHSEGKWLLWIDVTVSQFDKWFEVILSLWLYMPWLHLPKEMQALDFKSTIICSHRCINALALWTNLICDFSHNQFKTINFFQDLFEMPSDERTILFHTSGPWNKLHLTFSQYSKRPCHACH